MDEIRADGWLHLQELLYEESWKEELGRFRSDLVFRGQQDAASDLSTSLARLGGDYASLEPHLLRNFRKYAHADLRNETFWDWLARQPVRALLAAVQPDGAVPRLARRAAGDRAPDRDPRRAQVGGA